MMTYLRTEEVSLDKIGVRETFSFWLHECRGDRFPMLAEIAVAFLTTKASSGGIERDFSPAEDIVSPKRSNLDLWVVEVLLSLKLNYDEVRSDLKKVRVLSASEASDLESQLKLRAFSGNLIQDDLMTNTAAFENKLGIDRDCDFQYGSDISDISALYRANSCSLFLTFALISTEDKTETGKQSSRKST